VNKDPHFPRPWHRPRWLVTGLVWLAAAIVLGDMDSPLQADKSAGLPPLTSIPGNPRLPGKFVWADLVTDNLAAAEPFYAELLGWKFYDYGGYAVAYSEERPIAGMFARPRPADSQARPRWFAYMSVPNVGRAEKAVVQGGGKVLAAAKAFPKRGEQAVFSDPEGAVFGVVKSSEGDPADFEAAPGEWIWIQLLSHAAEKAAQFYRGVGGYEILQNTSSNRLNDIVLSSEGYARATIRTIPETREKVQPNWLLFVRVTNAKEAAAKAAKLGGQVLVEPSPELLQERIAVVADPTGAAIGLLEWSDDLLKGGQKP
jgi:predicted enzyme related to lactoylglutathione lyase